jgi:diguanylate cyclase
MYPTPPDEAERLKLLHALHLQDTPAEPVFDSITRLVAQILNVPT